jgi:acyl-coenzyme A synthetase/AMP-(fatty) acid ligase
MAAVDHIATAEQIASDLDIIQAKFLVGHLETLEVTLAAAKIYGLPESNILIFGDTGAEDNIRCVDDSLLSDEEIGVPIQYTKEEIMNDPVYLYFTSGTTGRKKAVNITQYAMCSTVHLRDWPYRNVNILSYTEFNHGSSLVSTMHFPLIFGSTAFIMAHYSFRSFCEAIQTHKIHLTTTQPYIIYALAKDSIADEYDLSSLKGVVCAGAALDPSIVQLAKEKLGLSVLNVYGMTEVLGLFHTTPEISLASGTGYLEYGFEAKLVDEEGNEVPEGEMGEFWMKGPTMSRGYYKNPEATANAFDADGYLHTGDLFKRDQEGLFTFIDRAKDLIKYHLHHIYPSEIEKVLITHPAVSDCVVIGLYYSEFATELPRAYIQLVEGAAENEDIEQELQEYADSQLPDAMRLRGGIVLDNSLPRTASGKIQRRRLKEIAEVDTNKFLVAV